MQLQCLLVVVAYSTSSCTLIRVVPVRVLPVPYGTVLLVVVQFTVISSSFYSVSFTVLCEFYCMPLRCVGTLPRVAVADAERAQAAARVQALRAGRLREARGQHMCDYRDEEAEVGRAGLWRLDGGGSSAGQGVGRCQPLVHRSGATVLVAVLSSPRQGPVAGLCRRSRRFC